MLILYHELKYRYPQWHSRYIIKQLDGWLDEYIEVGLPYANRAKYDWLIYDVYDYATEYNIVL